MAIGVAKEIAISKEKLVIIMFDPFLTSFNYLIKEN